MKKEINMSVYCNGEEIENNLGFSVARDMARLLSIFRCGIYNVVDKDGISVMTFDNGIWMDR
jgi:hypothetical protein